MSQAPANTRQAQEQHTIALTKRTLERRMMKAGVPKREAERMVARMSHAERLKRLSFLDVATIAWKVRR